MIEKDVTDSPTALPVVACSAGLGEPHLTLTIEEIRDLAEMCGLVVKAATAEEKEDERETEIAITPWPAGGIKDENGEPYGQAHKHLAFFEDYPEEGCVPLGSPNQVLDDKAAKADNAKTT
jgi:hypothetical protein